jgi:proteasome lid subunit RPN8/RPN11
MMNHQETADFYIDIQVIFKAYKYFVEKLPKEAMGFLIGSLYRYEGKIWVEISDFVPLKAEASETRVVPLEGSLKKVGKLLQKKKALIVGWAHSHPGFGCFLSDIDLTTQRKYFSLSHQVALVMDPYTGEYDLFVLKDLSYQRPHFKEIIKKEHKYAEI